MLVCNVGMPCTLELGSVCSKGPAGALAAEGIKETSMFDGPSCEYSLLGSDGMYLAVSSFVGAPRSAVNGEIIHDNLIIR